MKIMSPPSSYNKDIDEIKSFINMQSFTSHNIINKRKRNNKVSQQIGVPDAMDP
jgi:hypothetical protein